MGADRKWIIVRIDGKTVDIKAEATTIFKGNDIEDVNLEYRKQRKHTHKQTRKMIMRLLALLGKMLGEIRRQMRVHYT